MLPQQCAMVINIQHISCFYRLKLKKRKKNICVLNSKTPELETGSEEKQQRNQSNMSIPVEQRGHRVTRLPRPASPVRLHCYHDFDISHR